MQRLTLIVCFALLIVGCADTNEHDVRLMVEQSRQEAELARKQAEEAIRGAELARKQAEEAIARVATADSEKSQQKKNVQAQNDERSRILSNIATVERDIIRYQSEMVELDKQIHEQEELLKMKDQNAAKRDTTTKWVLGELAGGFVSSQKSELEQKRRLTRSSLESSQNRLMTLKQELARTGY